MAGIKGILFDLGDTLLDFGPVDTLGLFKEGARRAYAYLKLIGQPVPSFGRFHRRQLRAIRWSYVKSRITRREFNSLTMLRRVRRAMGQTLTERQLAELAWQWYQPLGSCASVEQGLGEMLRGFAGQGLKLGLISNTFVPGAVLDRHLSAVGLLAYLPVRIYSCAVGYRKPDGRIFRIALDALHLAASEAIFVGDTPAADIAGANRAGLISVQKDPSGTRTSRRIKPAYRIPSLRELPRIVGELQALAGTVCAG